MSLTKEPVCCGLQDLRNRLERLKESWGTSNTLSRPSGWAGFQQDWRKGWLRIEEMLSDIESRLGRRQKGRPWDVSQPAILRFPPAEEGIMSMGPF